MQLNHWALELFQAYSSVSKDGDPQQHSEIKRTMLSISPMQLIQPVDGILSIKVERKIILVLDLFQRRTNKNGNRFPSTSRLGYISGCVLDIVKPRRSMNYLRSCCFVMFQAEIFMMHQVELKVISNV